MSCIQIHKYGAKITVFFAGNPLHRIRWTDVINRVCPSCKLFPIRKQMTTNHEYCLTIITKIRIAHYLQILALPLDRHQCLESHGVIYVVEHGGLDLSSETNHVLPLAAKGKVMSNETKKLMPVEQPRLRLFDFGFIGAAVSFLDFLLQCHQATPIPGKPKQKTASLVVVRLLAASPGVVEALRKLLRLVRRRTGRHLLQRLPQETSFPLRRGIPKVWWQSRERRRNIQDAILNDTSYRTLLAQTLRACRNTGPILDQSYRNLGRVFETRHC